MKRKREADVCGCTRMRGNDPWPAASVAEIEALVAARFEETMREVRAEALTLAQRTLEERRRHLAQVHTEEESAYQL